MNQDEDNRRLLLAAALCLGVLGLWGVMNSPPPQPMVEQSSAATTETSTGTVVSETVVPPPNERSTSEGAEGVLPEARSEQVAPVQHRFSGTAGSGDDAVTFEVVFTNQGGALESFVLPSYSERNAKNRPTDRPIRLADSVVDRPARERAWRQMGGLAFAEGTSFEFPVSPGYEVVDVTGTGVRYRRGNGEGIVVEREWRVDPESFLLEGAVTVRNESDQSHRYRLALGSALKASEALLEKDGGWLQNLYPPADHLKGLCWSDGSVKRYEWKSLLEESQDFEESVQWVAVDRQYFLSALVLRDRNEATCRLTAEEDVVRSEVTLGEVSLTPGAEKRHKFTMVLGVKKPALLTVADASLESAIDYTVFGLDLAVLCAFLIWILGWFHDLTGSWGWAIVGLTVLVKVLLFPLNQRQGKAMRAMAALKPQMDALREKYADDRQRQNEELIKLYRSNNVNPAGGCLPLLLQMPIMFSLYRALWVSTDIYQQRFLWLSDLTVRDPYYILPILLVTSMFLQQRLMPSTMDPAQAKVMQYVLPLVFGLTLSGLPAGLCIYILVNTLLTIVQQHFINRSIGAPPDGGTEAAGAPATQAT
ncbi:MAG: membrane protein insertase YidC [Myxococcota bacterium]